MNIQAEINRTKINIQIWTKKRDNFLRLARINPGYRVQFNADAQPLTEAIERAEQWLAEQEA